MSEVIARIEQTREMLLAALAERNWEAVGGAGPGMPLAHR